MESKTFIVRLMVRIGLIVLLLCMLGTVNAYDFSQVNSGGGQTLYYNIIDATNHYVEITYPGSSTSLPWPNNKPTGNTALPENVDYNGTTYTVTAVGDYAFYMCSGLTCVIISNTISSIGDYAFYECSGLTGELAIPNSVITIGNRAFSNCNKLTGSLVIPDSVISIGYQAFLDCKGFTSLTMGNSLTTIGWGAFNTCYNISGQLIFPESVISIGGNAFRECYAITSVFIPNSVIELGYDPYYGADNPFPSCSSIGQIIVAADNPAFDSKENCNAIINSNTNELISGCKNSFIPNSVTSVGRNAFSYNLGLTSLVFGSSVTSIGDFAFYNCTNLTTMSIMTGTPPSVGSYCFLNVPQDIPIYVPCGSLEAYQSAEGWSDFINYHSLECSNFVITASPTEGGTVTGAGTYVEGTSCTLTATANEGYIFINWTENGNQVSTNANYCFTVTGDRTLVANFTAAPVSYTITATASPAAGGTVTGAGTYEAGQTCTVTATANAGYTFLYWAVNGALLSTEPTFTFTPTGDADCVARFYSGDAALQISPFTSGWNWYSTYIGQESIDGLAQLEGNLGSSGIQIKSQQQYVNYYEGMGWMGMLSSINNESTYKVKTSAPCVVEMIGEETTSAAHPITIGSGWNWIGYPVNTSMSVTSALSGITPTNGDQLKAQNGYANYYNNLGWMGTLSTITPGMGLLYKSNGNGNHTLVYPTTTKGETLAENITSENNHWVPDMHAYPDNMTVTAVVELEDVELGSDNYELAAFANGECRGSVRLMYVAPIDRHIAFLTVTGEDVEMLTFGLYDTQTGEEIYDAQEILNFSNNATVGDVREPYAIYFRGTVGLDEWANSLQVFPNPVRKGENVSLSLSADEIGKVQVEIINALGQVETIRTTTLQTTIAAPSVAGVYTLRITAEGKGTCYRKLVVR